MYSKLKISISQHELLEKYKTQTWRKYFEITYQIKKCRK